MKLQSVLFCAAFWLSSPVENFDQAVLENLEESYPSLDQESRTLLKLQLENGMRGSKRNLLHESEHFNSESTLPNRLASFQSWLVRKREDYEQLQVWSLTP